MKKIIERVKSWLNRKPSYWYVSYVFFNGEEKGCGYECIESPNQLFDFIMVNNTLKDIHSFKNVVILSFSKVNKQLYKRFKTNGYDE